MIKFWVPVGFYTQEILLPLEAMEILLRVAVHETGHAEVASHFGARVLGVALTFEPQGLVAMALYILPNDLATQDICTIFAAGSAGEILRFGNYTETGATGDRRDINDRHSEIPFDLIVEKAKAILVTRMERFDFVTSALQRRFFDSHEHLTMGILPNGKLGAFVLDEDDLR